MKVTTAFNAKSQQDEEAIVTIDVNDDYVFTFADKSFFKIPSNLSHSEVLRLIEVEKSANEGQVTVAQLEAQHAEKLSIFEEVPDAPLPEPTPPVVEEPVSAPQPTPEPVVDPAPEPTPNEAEVSI